MTFRIVPMAGVLLLAATTVAGAESPLPDPIAPAVIGRPLDDLRPARSHRHKPRSEKPAAARPLALRTSPAVSRPLPPVATAVPAPVPVPAPVVPPATTTLGAAPAVAPSAVAPYAAAPHAAKQALDDRVDPQARIVDDVGQGTHLGRKPLGPGAYLGSRAQAVVRSYYASQPAPGKASPWKIGEPVPPKVKMTGVPDEVRAALPRVPPGLQYVQLDGEVVLVAMQSKMVVDGVTRQR